MVPSAGEERERGPGHPMAAARAPVWTMPVYLAVLCALTALYLAVPSWHDPIWLAVSLAGLFGVLVGVLLHRPPLTAAWLLLAAGLTVLAVNESIDDETTVFLVRAPFLTRPDEVELVAYPLAAAGLWLFLRHQRSGRDAAAMVDALTVTAALGLLAWVALIWPEVHEPRASLHAREISVLYLLGDVLLLALLTRLLVASPNRPPALWLLVLGTVGLLVSDLVFETRIGHRSFSSAQAPDIGWIVFYGAWGAAGLHGSMAQVGRRGAGYRGAEISFLGLGLLAVASLVSPLVLMISAGYGDVHEVSVLATFAVASTVLVLLRLALALHAYRRAIQQAQVVRAAGASLVAAVNEDQVAQALSSAGTSLFGAGTGDGAIGLVTDRDPPPPATGQRAVFPLADKREPRHAVVVATGPQDRLATLHDTVETLAGQAALALDRVGLGREIRRLDNEAYFRTLIHNAADVFMIVDDRLGIRYASPSARTMFDGRVITGASLADLVGPVNAPSAMAALAGTGRGPAEWVIEGPDHRMWVEVRADDLRADPTVGGVVLTLRDVTDRRRLEGELRHHAYHDPLTGLANRRSLQDRLSRTIEQARTTGRDAGLLLIDLDDFKDVNDTKGHGVGDELLTAVAGRLRSGLRPNDLAARLGGDEFAVVVSDLSGPADADALAGRFARAFDQPFGLSDTTVSTGASIGVAITRGSGTAEDLLRNADLALYAAKADGKRRWRHFDPALQSQALERTALREHLDRAIEHGEVVLHYQPVVEIGDGRVAGFEALARWPHPVRGMVGPEVFIPLAEETGQIVPLGRLLLRRAVADAAAWNRERSEQNAGSLGVPLLFIAVNVSLRQFREQDFADETTALLESAGLPADLLVLELTESDLMRHHDEEARRTMIVLREQGVRIAIDDFGTGYSSLSYLRDLPIDHLKIDKSFIADVATSADQATLVEGIIRIADGLGLSVVAEGVETQEQWDILGGSDCDFGQGFLFSPPLSADSVGTLLATDRDPRLGEE